MSHEERMRLAVRLLYLAADTKADGDEAAALQLEVWGLQVESGQALFAETPVTGPAIPQLQ